MGRVPDFDYPAIHPSDVEMGAVCEDCDRPFPRGDRYASRLLGVAGGIPVTELRTRPRWSALSI